MVPAFEHSHEYRNGMRHGIIIIHPVLFDMLRNSSHLVAPWSLPMLVQPLPWLHTHSGGYLQHRFPLVRTGFNKEHDDYIKAAEEAGHLTGLMRSLDVLSSTAWRVNRSILEVAIHFWNDNKSYPCIPTDLALPLPEKPADLDQNPISDQEYKKKLRERDGLMANSFSERCNANYKLDIACAVTSVFSF
jgi:DNA-directed RNA polymerase